MSESIKKTGVGSIIQLLSADGRPWQCKICGMPVLGLFGQDQVVTERMVIQAEDSSLPPDVGWYHTRCVFEADVGKWIFDARVRSLSERDNRIQSEFFVSYHDWLQEIQICKQDGSFWLTTLDAFQHAVPFVGGIAVPVEHDIDLCVLGMADCNSLPRIDGDPPTIPISSILSNLGIVDRLLYPAILADGRFSPIPNSSPHDLAGRLSYKTFIPKDAAAALESILKK